MQPNNEGVDTTSNLQAEQGTYSTEQQLQTDTEFQNSQQQIIQQPFASNPCPTPNNQNIQDDSQSLSISADELQTIQQPPFQDNSNAQAVQFSIQQISPLLKTSTSSNTKKTSKQAQQINAQNIQDQQMPVFYNLLSDADKELYNKMRITLSSPACKHRRHHSKELNREIINSIKNFVVRNDPEDWKRALVTGIAWLPNAIAINTRQLRLLLSKCKSSINALFQDLGYYTIPTTNDYSSSIISCFPLLKDNFSELRKWTIRLVAPPDGKSPIHQQQQKMIIQQQNQSAQPIQIIQQPLPNENAVEIKQDESAIITTPHGNDSAICQQQLQPQIQNDALGSILTPKCPVEVNNQSS